MATGLNKKISDLERRLTNVRRRQRRAEKDANDIEAELDALRLEQDCETVRSWRGVPDWTELLKGNNGMVFFQLGSLLLERIGLSDAGVHAETGQRVISKIIFTHTDPEIAEKLACKAKTALESIPLEVQPSRDGMICVRVHNCDAYSVSLLLSPDRSKIYLAWSSWGTETERETFATLGEAIIYAQENFADQADDDCLEDYVTDIDAYAPDTYSGYWMRRGVEALIEGCRTAGAPLPDGAWEPAALAGE
jgi:hypothetical protein